MPDPTSEQKLTIALAHYDEMLEHYGRDVGVKFARKHLGWYSAGMHGGAEFRNKMNKEHNPDVVKDSITEFFGRNHSANVIDIGEEMRVE